MSQEKSTPTYVYSDSYRTDTHVYRHVTNMSGEWPTPQLAAMIQAREILTESVWRDALHIQQSKGWQHYDYYPGTWCEKPLILLFHRLPKPSDFNKSVGHTPR